MRKKLKALCSLHMLCATLFLFNLKAQTNNGFSIKGKVSDPNGGSLPYVNVFIEELDIGAVTNEKGRYQLEKIPSGQYTVRASLIGYKGRDRIVIVGDRGITGLDFILEEETQNLDEVVVKGKSEASRLRESAQAVTVVTTETVKLQAADMGDIMAKTEGVSVQRAGALGSNVRFSINGLADDQIRFFYDGIPLEFSPYAFGIANAPVNLIEQVEVYKGVVPIELGADALGGAINLVPQKIQNGLNGSASYQAGSFNTHRITGNISGANKDSGLFFSATGFYDYTDNNYKIDAAIANERGQLEQFEVERFHDGYRAAGADFVLGIRGKKWAKRLSVEGYYGDYDKDLQNSQFPGLIDQPSLGISNAVAGNPFGEVVFSTFSAGVNIDYALDFNSKWELGLKMGYNYNERESFDVGNNLYSWFGEVARVNQEAGEFGLEDNLITMSENVFARQQTTYSFNERHSIKLALSPTYTYRTADDLLVDGEFDPALDDNFLLNFVVGLEYTAEFAKGRLENIAFVKNYYQDIRSESVSPDVEGIQVLERNENNFGAGDAIRYNWSERFSTKLSYEYALRLPSQDEVFGDGQFILQNFELRPESSHNANLQWDYRSKSRAKMNWQLQGNLFLRQI
ncbi:MAG: carboxypeptidase-like regulatory domain-containing protein, partial [Bacteroidota bacterium]